MADEAALDLSKFKIEPIRAKPGRLTQFCGYPEIDHWIEREAYNQHCKGFRRVYCAYEEGSEQLVALYSLLMEVVTVRRPKPIAGVRLTDPFPALGIGYLAVSTSIQRKGLGSLMLADALTRAVALADVVAFPAVKLRAAEPWLVEYYGQRSFLQYDSTDEQRMLVPTRTLIEAARDAV
ncbi:GNAT superfamily N-acetyltransferase [Bosea sp. OAE506]|uniref:GNAT family N-acetyltransferase n=1 Tax=Bosea sp. OAE506 TaxID=2663870 RepID=UPI00178959F3